MLFSNEINLSRRNSGAGGSESSTRKNIFVNLNRTLSIRSNKKDPSNGGGRRYSLSLRSLRGSVQPEISRKLYRLIKSENHLITAHEAAGKERMSIASQLSDWGEQTGDGAISDISDKVGVLLSEIGEQEDLYAHNLDDSRGVLKTIRNTEKSVQPSRDKRTKIQDEIAKIKSKEPESTKLVILEHELVRVEAENLVAEAQLTNITRQKLKEAYAAEFAATIERAEKQIILARHGRRLLNLLDDTPVVPGDTRSVYEHGSAARQILNDAEDDLREWQPELENVESSAHMIDNNLMPSSTRGNATEGGHYRGQRTSGAGTSQSAHPSGHNGVASRVTSNASVNRPAYAQSEFDTGSVAQ